MNDYLDLIESCAAMASFIRAMYDAYLKEGFTEQQALKLCCAFVQGTANPN